ncbi:FecR family protein [Aquabacterium sp. OR-4]|uniref:FecR family protein n=1 Tax=Aquabacterium sp. OR-4 TaxID=2978127 RepID=UPI0021B47069|nr:FecR domain-containing protein [Aquabacterium sp. OR-4]MDT7833993.1 FecR domain-containing protein [Aquabacterium sp. OR-4]
MSAAMPALEHAPDPAVMAEAADWALTLQQGPLDAPTQHQFEAWRQRSPDHARAWARAQQVLGLFGQAPAALARPALDALTQQRRQRRRAGLLGLLAVAMPSGWLVWRERAALDATTTLATAVGQRRSIALPDGSQLLLNTGSRVQIVFDQQQRGLHLQAGELLVSTQPDPVVPARPFVVGTPAGEVQALGTRFSVRLLDAGQVRVGVYQHAVQVRPHAAAARRLQAGEGLDFTAQGYSKPRLLDDSATLWRNGMLLARNMRLAEVAAELARYRPGGLRCEPAAAELRVSGALSLDRPDDGVALLLATQPLRLDSTGHGPPVLRRR